MTNRASTIIAMTLLLAACGGGSDDAGDDDTATTTTADTTTSTTAAPTTVPPTTIPPTTAAPTTAAPTTAATTTSAPTTEPPDTTLDLEPFCDASEEYYVTSLALFTYVNSNAGAEVLFGFAIDEANAAIEAAPTAEFANEPTMARDALVELSAALTPVGFDPDLVDPDDVFEPATTLTQINGALETFIADGCGADLAALDDRGRSLAIGIDAQYPDDDPSDDGATAAPIDITDDSGVLAATVPGNWSDVRGDPDGERRRLVAAEDLDAFLASYTIPGLAMVSGDAEDAAAAVAANLSDARSGAQAGGCTVSISAPYDDGVYTGQEEFLECPGGGSVLHLIGGTNVANDVWFVMVLVVELGDTTTRDLVGDSFFVD